MLETVLSVIVGIIGGVFVGIFFAVRAVLTVLRYLTGKLIGKIIPSRRSGIEMKWMTRDLEKKSILHTGMFRTAELNGGATAKVFSELLALTQEFSAQKKRRAGITENAAFADVFSKTDALYDECLQQFLTAAEGIDWDKTDIWQQESASLPMKGAVERMQKVVAEHEKMLAHAQNTAAAQIPALPADCNETQRMQ